MYPHTSDLLTLLHTSTPPTLRLPIAHSWRTSSTISDSRGDSWTRVASCWSVWSSRLASPPLRTFTWTRQSLAPSPPHTPTQGHRQPHPSQTPTPTQRHRPLHTPTPRHGPPTQGHKLLRTPMQDHRPPLTSPQGHRPPLLPTQGHKPLLEMVLVHQLKPHPTATSQAHTHSILKAPVSLVLAALLEWDLGIDCLE